MKLNGEVSHRFEVSETVYRVRDGEFNIHYQLKEAEADKWNDKSELDRYITNVVDNLNSHWKCVSARMKSGDLAMNDDIDPERLFDFWFTDSYGVRITGLDQVTNLRNDGENNIEVGKYNLR